MFCALTDREVEAAYDIYLSAFAWLRARQIRQWLVPTPRDKYLGYVANREMFGHSIRPNSWLPVDCATSGTLIGKRLRAIKTSGGCPPWWFVETAPTVRRDGPSCARPYRIWEGRLATSCTWIA